jgi:hypothetical protein
MPAAAAARGRPEGVGRPPSTTSPFREAAPNTSGRISSRPEPVSPAMPRTSPTTGREVDVVDHEAAELTRLQDDLVPARASPGGRGPHRFTTDHQRYEPIMLELNRVVGADATAVAEHRDAVGDREHLVEPNGHHAVEVEAVEGEAVAMAQRPYLLEVRELGRLVTGAK